MGRRLRARRVAGDIAPKDYDVATSAEPAQVREVFGRRRTIPVGAAFGVITVLGGKGRDPIEVATFRSDGRYLDGRRPESVEFTDAEHDALRRDFTINGLFFDPVDERVIDYVGGREDLSRKLVRAIGDPRERFTEDKLRLLRAVRFAATFDFEIEAETLRAVREMADQIEVVSAERIGAELRQVLSHPHAARGLALLAETGLLGHLLPEIAPWAEAADARWAAVLDRLDRLGGAPLAAALAAVLLEADGANVPALGRRLRFTNKEAADRGLDDRRPRGRGRRQRGPPGACCNPCWPTRVRPTWSRWPRPTWARSTRVCCGACKSFSDLPSSSTPPRW